MVGVNIAGRQGVIAKQGVVAAKILNIGERERP
jgi:hypothetical protein